jgi:hypothetical protein
MASSAGGARTVHLVAPATASSVTRWQQLQVSYMRVHVVSALLCLFCAASLLVSGDPDKGRPLADQENLATSITRLVGLLGQAQHYVDEVVVSVTGCLRVGAMGIQVAVCVLYGCAGSLLCF